MSSEKHWLRESDELLLEARESSERWDMLTQNHDPAFQKWMKEAFIRGWLRGYRECEVRLMKSIGDGVIAYVRGKP